MNIYIYKCKNTYLFQKYASMRADIAASQSGCFYISTCTHESINPCIAQRSEMVLHSLGSMYLLCKVDTIYHNGYLPIGTAMGHWDGSTQFMMIIMR